jgi:hypothetical protein
MPILTPVQRLDRCPAVAQWRAAQARQAAKRQDGRVRPWRPRRGAVISENGRTGRERTA